MGQAARQTGQSRLTVFVGFGGGLQAARFLVAQEVFQGRNQTLMFLESLLGGEGRELATGPGPSSGQTIVEEAESSGQVLGMIFAVDG